MGWLRVPSRLSTAVALSLTILVIGCSNTVEPEKAENTGNATPPPVQERAPVAPTPSPAAPPAAPVQTPIELSERAEASEKKLRPLRAAALDEPANAGAQHALGRALFEANYKEEALTYLEKAAELEPTTRTLLDLAVAYSGAARLDDAEAAYGRLLKQNPGFPIALHNLGSLAYRRGNHERAIAHFGHALQADPAYLLARLHLGEALEAAGRPREAYRAYEQVLGMEPRNPQEAKGYIDALYGLAALDLANGAHERAGQLLTELIRIAPNHNKAYYAYGQVLLYMGHPEDAQKAFDKHVQILAAEEPKGPVAMGD